MGDTPGKAHDAGRRRPVGSNARSKPWIKPVAALVVLAGLIVVLRATGVTDYLTIDALSENIDRVRAARDRLGIWGPIAYILVYIASTLLFLPGLAITLVAGLFGVAWGTVFVSIGSTIGASLAFLLARYTLRPMVEEWAAKNAAFKKIDDGVKEHGWRMVMITRLVPLFPFNLQNYAYGLTKVSFGTYVLVSWICMLPGTIAYVFLSGAIVSGEGDPGKILVYLAIGGVFLAGLSFVPRLVQRRFQIEKPADPPVNA